MTEPAREVREISPEDPPQWGGVRCPCGEEVLPYVMNDGTIGVHFMDACDSRDVLSLKQELWNEIDSYERDPELVLELHQWRACFLNLVAIIDEQLQAGAS